jgi:LPXTG-motif cell wall-anchored protein
VSDKDGRARGGGRGVVNLLARIAFTIAAVVIVSIGFAGPAAGSTGPTIHSARHPAVVEPPPVLLSVAGTASCDRSGHASILWKVTSAVGPLYLFGLTSPNALKPAGSTITEQSPWSNTGLTMRQLIPGTHGKGTASIEVQGYEFSDPNRVPPLIAQGTVRYDCSPTLPVTGSRSATYVAIGGALIVAGLGLVVLSRRRHSRTGT